MIRRNRLLDLMRSVLSYPTAPFHEHQVLQALYAHARALGLPAAADRWGNLHVRYRRGRRPPWILLAHADHPGFFVTRTSRHTAYARWFGRVAAEYFVGRPVLLHHPLPGVQQRPLRGEVRAIRCRGERVTEIRIATQQPVVPGWIGSWDLPACRISGDRIAARAADDLVGCALLAALLESLVQESALAAVDVVYTRAEEAGLLGAAELARSRSVPTGAPVLSLEASPERAGVKLGAGVIVRLGDRFSSFDPLLLDRITVLAAHLDSSRPRFRFRRALMDGGTCEATPFAAFGYRAAGLAVPLRNYHNMGRHDVAAERVQVSDLTAALALLVALAHTRPPTPDAPLSTRAQVRRQLRGAGPRLRRSALAPAPWPARSEE